MRSEASVVEVDKVKSKWAIRSQGGKERNALDYIMEAVQGEGVEKG